MVAGRLLVPEWVEPGPAGVVDLSVRARQGHGDAAFLGLSIPLGDTTNRALTLLNSWPTAPLSWPDRSYGIGPLNVCNRYGRAGQPNADYRNLRLTVEIAGKPLELQPSRDGRGCADADDAVYAGHFLDQVLSEESGFGEPDPIRVQPAIEWRTDLPLIHSTPSWDS